MEEIKYQNHHITPKCMLKHKPKEFVDRPENIVRLKLKYHRSVHKWLFMLTGDAGCENAYYAMKNRKYVTRACPEHQKKILSELMRGSNNHFYGRKHSEESKRKMRESRWGKGYTPISKDHRKKLIDGRKNSLYIATDEHKKNLSEANFGGKNHNSKKCVVHGKMFFSMSCAARFFNVGHTTIDRWIKANKVFCYKGDYGRP